MLSYTFGNHRRFTLCLLVCVLAIPTLGIDHDWNVSVSYSIGSTGSRSTIEARLDWNPPPLPHRAYRGGYHIHHVGGNSAPASKGDSGGSVRLWQGYSSAKQLNALFQEIISESHTFIIDWSYYVDSDWHRKTYEFTWPSLVPTDPSPADGAAAVVPRGQPLVLRWSLERPASGHRVYISDAFEDVDKRREDAFLGSLLRFPVIGSPGSDYPHSLIPGKTYYWVVDEVDNNRNTLEGDIWSFWVKPYIPPADPNLVCSWTFDLSEGTYVIDWSGRGHDGISAGEPQWVDGYHGRAMQLTAEGDRVACALDDVSDWPVGTVAFWVKADTVGQDAWSGVFSSYSEPFFFGGIQIDVDGGHPGNYQVDAGGLTFGAVATDWIHLALTFEHAMATLYYNARSIESGPLSDTRFNQFALGVNRNMANSLFGTFDDFRVYDYALTQTEITQVMRADSLTAWDPSPVHGSVSELEGALPLKWSPGEGMSYHDVYFGTMRSAVAEAHTGNTSEIYRGRQSLSTYTPPEPLSPGQAYYWRIDELTHMHDSAPRKGPIWSFTLQPAIAHRPYPSNGSTRAQQDVILSWMSGSTGVLHDVYVGTHAGRVQHADAFGGSGIYQGRWPDTHFSIEQLDYGQTYYWRIDDVEADGVTLHKGSVWHFTVLSPEATAYDSDDFETEDIAHPPWRLSGDAHWFVSKAEALSGGSSVQAGRIDHSQSTSLILEGSFAAGRIVFWRKVSSEEGYDCLKCVIDGEQAGEWSGDEDWRRESFSITPGPHTVEWRYQKDSSKSEGEDTAWIDAVSFVPGP